MSVQQLATLKLSPYCRHDNTKTMSVRVHAVTRQQKATAEEKDRGGVGDRWSRERRVIGGNVSPRV